MPCLLWQRYPSNLPAAQQCICLLRSFCVQLSLVILEAGQMACRVACWTCSWYKVVGETLVLLHHKVACLSVVGPGVMHIQPAAACRGVHTGCHANQSTHQRPLCHSTCLLVCDCCTFLVVPTGPNCPAVSSKRPNQGREHIQKQS